MKFKMMMRKMKRADLKRKSKFLVLIL